MSEYRVYSYNEDYDLDKCIICGKKMPNEDEPTCSLRCEKIREEREEKSKQQRIAKEKEEQNVDRETRIREILGELGCLEGVNCDAVEELEELIFQTK